MHTFLHYSNECCISDYFQGLKGNLRIHSNHWSIILPHAAIRKKYRKTHNGTWAEENTSGQNIRVPATSFECTMWIQTTYLRLILYTHQTFTYQSLITSSHSMNWLQSYATQFKITWILWSLMFMYWIRLLPVSFNTPISKFKNSGWLISGHFTQFPIALLN